MIETKLKSIISLNRCASCKKILLYGSVCQQKQCKRSSTKKVISRVAIECKPKIIKRKVEINLNTDDAASVYHICPHCKTTRATVEIRQMRAADEGASIFYTCSNCGRVDRSDGTGSR